MHALRFVWLCWFMRALRFAWYTGSLAYLHALLCALAYLHTHLQGTGRLPYLLTRAGCKKAGTR